jgi:hypothetical protein
LTSGRISAEDEVPVWKLSFREPFTHMFRDRLVLIGDSLHPMLPCTLDAVLLPEQYTDKPYSQSARRGHDN